jgi:hypothetical protein
VRGIKATTVEETDWADDFDFSPRGDLCRIEFTCACCFFIVTEKNVVSDSSQLSTKLQLPNASQRSKQIATTKKQKKTKRAGAASDARSVLQMPPIIGAVVNAMPGIYITTILLFD